MYVHLISAAVLCVAMTALNSDVIIWLLIKTSVHVCGCTMKDVSNSNRHYEDDLVRTLFV